MVHNSFEADSFYVTAYKGTLISQFAKADRLDASSFSFSLWSPPFSLFFQLYIAHVHVRACVHEGVRVCCELGQSDPRFFSNAKMSKMSPTRWLEHVVKDTVNSPLSSSPSSIVFLLIVFVTLRYVSTFERDVFAEGEESLRREFIMRGFMGSLKGSLFGIIYFLRYY